MSIALSFPSNHVVKLVELKNSISLAAVTVWHFLKYQVRGRRANVQGENLKARRLDQCGFLTPGCMVPQKHFVSGNTYTGAKHMTKSHSANDVRKITLNLITNALGITEHDDGSFSIAQSNSALFDDALMAAYRVLRDMEGVEC